MPRIPTVDEIEPADDGSGFAPIPDDQGMPAVILGIAVTLYTLPNGQQIVCAPYEEFISDLKRVLSDARDEGVDEGIALEQESAAEAEER